MSSTHPVGHAGKRATPILDQCISTETNRGLAFLSAFQSLHPPGCCGHLCHQAACLRLPVGSWDLGFEGFSSPHGQSCPPDLVGQAPMVPPFYRPEKVSHSRS